MTDIENLGTGMGYKERGGHHLHELDIQPDQTR